MQKSKHNMKPRHSGGLPGRELAGHTLLGFRVAPDVAAEQGRAEKVASAKSGKLEQEHPAIGDKA